MAEVIIMPRQGNTVETCLLVSWKKQLGESIQTGELLCEVETDKTQIEVECDKSGTLLHFLYEEGDDIPVLAPIAIVGEPGENSEALLAEIKQSQHSQESAVSQDSENYEKPQRSAAVIKSEPSHNLNHHVNAEHNGALDISPRAKKLALAKGIAFQWVKGSGPGDRVLERDIRYIIDNNIILNPLIPSSPQAAGQMSREIEYDFLQEKDKCLPLTKIRKLIAQRMSESLASTAQYTIHASADARKLLNLRKTFKETPELAKVTLGDLILYATVLVLLDHPEINALYGNGYKREYEEVHLAFAVDTPRGLMVPVIFKAHEKSLLEISQEAKELAAQCLEGNIDPDKLSGGTFTVSNLGMLGVESFTPILNTPQVGILGVCAIQPKAVMNDEQEVEFVPSLGLSLTSDHQLVDGALAARFLQSLCQKIAGFQWVENKE